MARVEDGESETSGDWVRPLDGIVGELTSE
jgi:hypothetical protein